MPIHGFTSTSVPARDEGTGSAGRHLRIDRWLRKRLTLDAQLADFSRRDFRTNRPVARELLEGHARTFLVGFNVVVCEGVKGLTPTIAELPTAERGFAVEGAAMAGGVLDALTGGRGRNMEMLLAEHGERYVHLLHVGVGWARAKLRLPGWVGERGLDPLLRWLAHDGWGFYQVYFGADRALARFAAHRFRCDGRCAIRHQGLGRGLWFLESADTEAIAARVERFPARHRGDLWSGVGLAATYAGGATTAELEQLARFAGVYRPHLAQGAAFAAGAWWRAGGVPEPLDAATRVLTGAIPSQAAAWTARALEELGEAPSTVSDYAAWRRRIRQHATAAREATP